MAKSGASMEWLGSFVHGCELRLETKRLRSARRSIINHAQLRSRAGVSCFGWRRCVLNGPLIRRRDEKLGPKGDARTRSESRAHPDPSECRHRALCRAHSGAPKRPDAPKSSAIKWPVQCDPCDRKARVRGVGVINLILINLFLRPTSQARRDARGREKNANPSSWTRDPICI